MAARKASIKTLIKSLSVADLQAIIAKKATEERKRLPELRSRLSELEAEIAEVGGEIGAIESAAGVAPKRRRGRPAAKKAGRRRGPGRPRAKAKAKVKAKAKGKRGAKRGPRPKRDMSLRQAIAKVLGQKKGVMSPAQVRDAIIAQKLYEKPTKTFYQQIVIRLSQAPEFVSLGRGQYKLKK